MKFKLDENLGDLGRALLEAAGHDVMTVRDQNLVGVSDRKLFDVCQGEGRVLITLRCVYFHCLMFCISLRFKRYDLCLVFWLRENWLGELLQISPVSFIY